MKMMKKTKTFSLERKRARYGYLFTLPLILGLAFIFIPNIVQTVLYSLNETVIDGSGYTLEWIGLKYYTTMRISPNGSMICIGRIIDPMIRLRSN